MLSARMWEVATRQGEACVLRIAQAISKQYNHLTVFAPTHFPSHHEGELLLEIAPEFKEACVQRAGARREEWASLLLQCMLYVRDQRRQNVIFHADLQVFGRGFDEYVKKGADEYGFRYVRARPGEITEDPGTKNPPRPVRRHRRRRSEGMEAEMVVLSTAFVPPPGVRRLAESLGVDMDSYDFLKASDDLLAPMDTNVPGIYIAGA